LTQIHTLISVKDDKANKADPEPLVVVDKDKLQMSEDNTLKDVANRMPESEFNHTIDNTREAIFSNEQLL
jgi:hypothetical protein